MTIAEIITENSGIALGVASATGAGFVAVTIWLFSSLAALRSEIVKARTDLQTDIATVRTDFALLKQSVDARVEGNLKLSDFERFLRLNPDLRVPEDRP